MIIDTPQKVGTLMRLLIPAEMALHEFQGRAELLDKLRYDGAWQLICRISVASELGSNRELFDPLLRALTHTYSRYSLELDDVEVLEKSTGVLMRRDDYVSLLGIEAAAEGLHALLSTPTTLGADFDPRRASNLLGHLRNWVSAHPNPNIIAQGEDLLTTQAGIASLTRMQAMYGEQVKRDSLPA
ncbi:hypothetical protein HNP46_006332 [Pseudomonas nitritireducens]|uniref:Uncharacterized protein n=1 Tax=Pseudomonas nitroreducens TaxID=46680 RepID=A0A7W7KR32_PSENT|nr:hypothetical protein [Pseudomonas nitritireducens]MBB4867419.1 hypothetical protein [Pseudomonas nitritireducens]